MSMRVRDVVRHADDLDDARSRLVERGVSVTEFADHSGLRSVAISDPEGGWFAASS